MQACQKILRYVAESEEKANGEIYEEPFMNVGEKCKHVLRLANNNKFAVWGELEMKL